MPNVTFLNIPILINQGFPVRRMIGIKAHLNLLPVILLLREHRIVKAPSGAVIRIARIATAKGDCGQWLNTGSCRITTRESSPALSI